jgi:SAM-dependent methyltransferase
MKRIPANLALESKKLAAVWQQYEPDLLRTYLVSGVEDPRLNIQSILTRIFLARALFSDQFEQLIDEELRFGMVMNWLLHFLEQPLTGQDLTAVLYALSKKSDNAEGLEIPEFITLAHAALPTTHGRQKIPNYLENLLKTIKTGGPSTALPEAALNLFQNLWRKALVRKRASKISVLEVACGSANDYRFMDGNGLARFLKYSGRDISEKNITNAQKMFPKVDFAVGDAMRLKAKARQYDVVLAHDLFEHLSIAGMEKAVAEVCRVCRHGMSLGFFRLTEEADHVVKPDGDYHCNTLSLPRLRKLFARHGFAAQVLHVGTFLEWKFGCNRTHNPNAYTLWLWRE